MSKQDFDKLFQEKLKDFQEMPDEKVWKSIEYSLDRRKQRKRGIPIWWKLGGVAAVLVLGLVLFNPFTSSEVPESIITDVEQSEPPLENNAAEGPVTDYEEIPGVREDGMTDADRSDSPTGADGLDGVKSSQKAFGVAKVQEQERNSDAAEDQVVMTAEEDKSLVDDITAVSENTVVPDISQDTKEDVIAGKLNNELGDKDEQVIAERIDQRNGTDTELIDKNLENTDAVVTEQTEKPTADDTNGKKSIFDEIDKQEEEEVLAQGTDSRWSVGPSVAPVYFDSFGDGSPIHSSFTSNSKSGNVNLSYGIGVGYDISEKLSIRSGIHKVDYGYDTNDIIFSSSLVASTSTVITNIDYTSTSKNLVVENGNTPEVSQDFSANDIVAQSPSRDGRMVQEFGYLEVPLELNYALLDQKFNIDIIGGFSSLFLISNNVTLESSGTTTELGEANNLNDVNFSTNLGLDFNYEISDKMKVHLEPMFKYQMNMFSGTEGNFQPYSVGLYTGLSFKF